MMRVTYIVPAVDEVQSLRETVETLFRLAASSVGEIIVVLAHQVTPSCRKMAQLLAAGHSQVRVHQQHLPGLGGALQEAFLLARCEYLMIMSSDLETDPARVGQFLRRMSEGDCDIVCGSRWLRGGGFTGYGVVKLGLNWWFQRVIGVMYHTSLTDATFGFRLYRRSVLEGVWWQELGYPFLLESLLRPLVRGARVVAIPCQWRPRAEGASHNSFSQMARYFIVAWRVWWQWRVSGVAGGKR